MRLISLSISPALVLAGCVIVNNSAGRALPRVTAEQQLFQADRAFADATHAGGIDGWMSFFAPDAVRIKYGGGMAKGYDAVRLMDTPFISDSTITLNWQPLEAHVFQHGTAGITIGTSQVVTRTGPNAGQVTYRGRYTTLWRRESDGTWKVIMDTGYPEPPAR